MFCKRCRQRTRKTEEKLSIIFSTIKLIESLFFEKDTYAMQATNPQNRNQNIICFFTFKLIKNYLELLTLVSQTLLLSNVWTRWLSAINSSALGTFECWYR